MMVKERVKLGSQLWALNPRRAVCHAEGRLLLSGKRNSGEAVKKEHTKQGQLWLPPSRWACHPPTSPPQYHLDSQGLQANEMVVLSIPMPTWLLSEITTKWTPATGKPSSPTIQTHRFATLEIWGTSILALSFFPVGKWRPGTRRQWEAHNHRMQSENSGFLRSGQSSDLSTIAQGASLVTLVKVIQCCRKSFTQRSHEIAAALNWWHSVI